MIAAAKAPNWVIGHIIDCQGKLAVLAGLFIGMNCDQYCCAGCIAAMAEAKAAIADHGMTAEPAIIGLPAANGLTVAIGLKLVPHAAQGMLLVLAGVIQVVKSNGLGAAGGRYHERPGSGVLGVPQKVVEAAIAVVVASVNDFATAVANCIC